MASMLLCSGNQPLDLSCFKKTNFSQKFQPSGASQTSVSFSREKERLESFTRGWPELAQARPRDLASSGFYFVGRQDNCQCFSCGLRLFNWRWADTPAMVHRRHSPNCRMVLGKDVHNVRLDDDRGSDGEGGDSEEENDENLDSSRVTADSGDARETMRLPTNATSSSPTTSTKSRKPRKIKLEDQKEKFRTKAQRLESFVGKWPKGDIMPTDELAKCGFYYGGTRDRVICAYCGLILLNFKPGDTAFGEHFKHTANCVFLKCLSDPQAERSAEMKNEEDLYPEDPKPDDAGYCSGPPSLEDTVKFVGQLGYTQDEIDRALESIKIPDDAKQLSSTTLLDALDQVSGTSETTENTEKKKKSSKNEELDVLKAENRRLAIKCWKCDSKANMLLLPCSHLVSCDKCCVELKTCPQCERQVLGGVKTYMV